jgi:hypothetical protein
MTMACQTARAGNRRFPQLSALYAHTKAPYKTDLLWETPRPLKRPGWARTGGEDHELDAEELREGPDGREQVHGGVVEEDCRGRKSPLSAAKRPARPCKSAIQIRITRENAKGA